MSKHRGEPEVKWVVEMLESERGWGVDSWDMKFDDEAQARAFFDANQAKAGPVPDYYCIAVDIREEVQ